MSHKKELKRIKTLVERHRYYIDRKGHNHIKIRNEQGTIVYTMPASPSDGNQWRQAIRDLIKLGILQEEDKPWKK